MKGRKREKWREQEKGESFCFYSHFRSGLRLYSSAEFALSFNGVVKCGFFL